MNAVSPTSKSKRPSSRYILLMLLYVELYKMNNLELYNQNETAEVMITVNMFRGQVQKIKIPEEPHFTMKQYDKLFQLFFFCVTDN